VSAPDLASALGALRTAGAAARLSETEIDDEAAAFVAGVSAALPAAAEAWARAFQQPAVGFGTAAAKGRPWRDAPTPLLARLVAAGPPEAARGYAEALVELASAACELGDPDLTTIANAGVAAAAQLRVVGGPVLDPRRSASVPAVSASSPSGAPVPASGLSASGSPATGSTPATATAAPTTAASPAPTAPPPSLDELLAQLDELVGLATVKTEVHRQAELLRVEAKRTAKGLKTPEVTRHLVFEGNPGTGKSTVARLVGGIYRALGLLVNGHVVETDRSGLVAGYLGQTAEKTSGVLKQAFGGLLFIDEAYALVGDQYGDEAIATLVKAMEDHREELVVIVAGYPAPMQQLIATNPGLASRFRLTIHFDDYTTDELVTIFQQQCRDADFTPDDDCLAALRGLLDATPRDEAFGNARFVRNTFEAAVVRQAWRLRDVSDPSVDQLRELRPEDLVDAVAPPSTPVEA
jgi:Holliday junction resolvasome RuvABC ATP-dependent DNA helicase subunit